jgi:hypothetical protein
VWHKKLVFFRAFVGATIAPPPEVVIILFPLKDKLHIPESHTFVLCNYYPMPQHYLLKLEYHI